MPKIYLYAEVLPHIRQLTLYASIQTDKDEGPQIDVSSDKKVITVKHDGESQSLFLPTQISGTAQVNLLSEKKTEVSARVQIEDLQQWRTPAGAGIESPWDAAELSPATTLQCRECNSELLGSQVHIWKDLPNQDWADVQDLWYCHKPHDQADTTEQKQSAHSKGFSATSRLTAQTGCGLVDVVSFVLHPDDCQCYQISDSRNDNTFKLKAVHCTRCGILLGSFSAIDNLVRFYKSRLRVQPSPGLQTYPRSIFVCAQLLSLIEGTPVRRVVVHSTEFSNSSFTSHDREPAELHDQAQGGRRQISHSTINDVVPSDKHHQETAQGARKPRLTKEPGLLLWIFNPDIYYSSSMHPSCRSTVENPVATAHRAMKIFYKALPNPQEYLDSTPATQIEELHLPSQDDVNTLRQALEASTAILPQSARSFPPPVSDSDKRSREIGHSTKGAKKAKLGDTEIHSTSSRNMLRGDGATSESQIPSVIKCGPSQLQSQPTSREPFVSPSPPSPPPPSATESKQRRYQQEHQQTWTYAQGGRRGTQQQDHSTNSDLKSDIISAIPHKQQNRDPVSPSPTVAIRDDMTKVDNDNDNEKEKEKEKERAEENEPANHPSSTSLLPTLTFEHHDPSTSSSTIPTPSLTDPTWAVGLLDRYEKISTADQVMGENPLARKPQGEEGDGRVTRWELPAGWRELYI